MINRKELAICKRRGHDASPEKRYWEQCKQCGMWLRLTIEERQTEPPEDEQHPLARSYARLVEEKKQEAKKVKKAADRAQRLETQATRMKRGEKSKS